MVTEQDRDMVVDKLLQIWNHGQIEVVDELFSEDYHAGLMDPLGQDREAERRGVQSFYDGFSDMEWRNVESMMQGERMMLRFKGTGRHTGEFAGMPATGKMVEFDGVAIYALRNGKIYEGWEYFDLNGLLAQLGAFPGASGTSSWEERAAVHHETTVRAGQTDLHGGQKRDAA
jgi:steroid delta-isomerase-like uncharacterized protein